MQDMLRRKLLGGVFASAAAAALWTCAGDPRLALADELHSTAATITRSVWHGIVKASGARVRSAPSTTADILADLPPGTDLDIDKWVAGTEVYPTLITWGQLADGSGYVYGGSVGPRPTETRYVLAGNTTGLAGKWIDVDLTQNLIAACQDNTVVGVFATAPGRPGWETTRGLHHVLYQRRTDDMAGPGYYVRGVQWVSYFLPDGEAIHARTWDVDAISFGVPSSHGCLGLALDDAAFVYQFVSPGTPIYVHD